MTASILIVALRFRIPHLKEPSSGPSGNLLYDSWVKRVDVKGLLDRKDIKKYGKLLSLLDGTVLEEVGEEVITHTGEPVERPYLADPMELRLSVTNLTGVPFDIHFTGEDHRKNMVPLHGDYLHFYYGKKSDRLEKMGALRLDPTDRQQETWKALKESALACGAFPMAFPPRILEREASLYGERKWAIPHMESDDPPCCEERSFQHLLDESKRYSFLMMDGGMADNEPIGQAEQILYGGPCLREGDASSLHSSVVMVDPFPDPMDPEHYENPEVPGIFRMVEHMVDIMLGLTKFQVGKIIKGKSEDFSGFLVAPVRPPENGRERRCNKRAIASGGMGGFTGFFSETFRNHDYFLGRWNCYWFLKKYYNLPADHPLFDHWSSSLREDPRFVVERDGRKYLPLLPLVGNAAPEPVLPPWVTLPGKDRKKLERGLLRRMDAVVRRTVAASPPSLRWLLYPISWVLWPVLRFLLMKLIVNLVMKQLKESELA